MMPRLKQPLFSTISASDAKRLGIFNIIRAYDCIWTLMYRPDDLTVEQRNSNARVNLNSLGDIIEAAASAEAFEYDPRQLCFPDEIIDVQQPAQPSSSAFEFKLK